MRILLINSNRYCNPWPVMPFGLCYVAETLIAKGYQAQVLDLCFSKDTAGKIAEAVRSFSPDAVGVSIRNIDNCVGMNSKLVLEDVRDNVIVPLKRVFQGPIIAGGCALGVSARRILSFLDLDLAVRGDGERAIGVIAEHLEKGDPLSGIPGLVMRKNGDMFEDNEPARPENLDILPWPRVHRHLEMAEYRKYNSPLQIQSKRGCELGCSYCTYNSVEGRTYRLRDPQGIVDEMEELVKETGIRHFEFVDSTFNIPIAHAKAILRVIVDRGLQLRLRTMGLNPGAIDEDLVSLMKQAGFRDVDIGAESGCDVTLLGLGKNYSCKDLYRTSFLLKKYRISAHWFVILGGPGETAQTALETFATMDKIVSEWDVAGFNVGLRVYHGAPIAEKIRQKDPAFSKDDFFSPCFFQPEGISLEDLQDLAVREADKRTNFMLYDKVDQAPAWLVKTLSMITDKVGLRIPLWKVFIVSRKTQKWIHRLLPINRPPGHDFRNPGL